MVVEYNPMEDKKPDIPIAEDENSKPLQNEIARDVASGEGAAYPAAGPELAENTSSRAPLRRTKPADSEAVVLRPEPLKPPRRMINPITALTVFSILAISSIVFCLFWQRDIKLSQEYKAYFFDVVPAMDNIRANFDAFSTKSEELIRRSLGLDTSENFMAEKEEYLMVLAGNIRSCETIKKRINSQSTPFNAMNSRDGMLYFFDRTILCFMTLGEAVKTGDPAGLEKARNIMNELAGYKVPGFLYED